MKYDPARAVREPPQQNRRSLRLKGYDYSQAGAYFVTICTQNRGCLFGEILDKEMILNDSGWMVEKWYGELENKFADIVCDQCAIMPNHIHFIIQTGVGADLRVCPDTDLCVCPDTDLHVYPDTDTGEHILGGVHTGSPLRTVIQWFKTMTTNGYIRGVKQNGWSTFPGKLWQRNYYEHIIRNENELNRIREYIINNPLQWELDRENPNGQCNKGRTHRCAPTGMDEQWRI